jgi:two-component system, OmpR family, phosphate regulon response regulator OmpR
VTRLRRKIELDPKQPMYLRTVRHKGYALWPSARG